MNKPRTVNTAVDPSVSLPLVEQQRSALNGNRSDPSMSHLCIRCLKWMGPCFSPTKIYIVARGIFQPL